MSTSRGTSRQSATWIQAVRADELATASSLSEQADGGHRYEYNPRLVAAARAIERGTILDRHGLVLATSNPAEIREVEATFGAAGVARVQPCEPHDLRCYPLGGTTFTVAIIWVCPSPQYSWHGINRSPVLVKRVWTCAT